jgi:hypothetical protein
MARVFGALVDTTHKDHTRYSYIYEVLLSQRRVLYMCSISVLRLLYVCVHQYIVVTV